MSNLAFKRRITRKAFDAKMIDEFGYDDLTVSPYNENGLDDNGNPTTQRLSLYYFEGIHVGTWTKGEGWIFKSAYLIEGAPKSLAERLQ